MNQVGYVSLYSLSWSSFCSIFDTLLPSAILICQISKFSLFLMGNSVLYCCVDGQYSIFGEYLEISTDNSGAVSHQVLRDTSRNGAEFPQNWLNRCRKHSVRWHICTLQEHQTIPTNATLFKVSTIEIQWRSMRKLDFWEFERNQEMCVKTNIAENYFKIRWSKLHWNFSTIYKDGCDNYRFCWNFSIIKLHYHPMTCTFWLLLEICKYQSHPYILWKSSNIVRITLF